jgi:hypothetical protein
MKEQSAEKTIWIKEWRRRKLHTKELQHLCSPPYIVGVSIAGRHTRGLVLNFTIILWHDGRACQHLMTRSKAAHPIPFPWGRHKRWCSDGLCWLDAQPVTSHGRDNGLPRSDRERETCLENTKAKPENLKAGVEEWRPQYTPSGLIWSKPSDSKWKSSCRVFISCRTSTRN